MVSEPLGKAPCSHSILDGNFGYYCDLPGVPVELVVIAVGWTIDDYSIHATVELVAAVGWPNELVVETIVGMMDLVGVMAVVNMIVVLVPGIADNWYNVDDDSNVGCAHVTTKMMMTMTMMKVYPNDAMELVLVLVAVHDI